MNSKTISTLMKKVLSLVLVLCFILNNTVAYAAPAPNQIDYLLPQCEEITEAQLRTSLNNTIEKFFNNQTDIEFERIVNQQWQILSLSSVIDSEVDRAVSMVSNDTGWMSRFKSSWIPAKAKTLANEVAQIAFNSPSLKQKLNQLSKNVSEELSDKLEVASAKSSSYALDCLQKFVNRQYSQTFESIFSEKIRASQIDSDLIDSLNPSATQYINKHKFGIAGSAILATYITARVKKKVVGTIVDRIFQQVFERVLGRFGSGFIPFVGEVVGTALIVGDIAKSFDGALPEIQKSLKSLEVKQNIQIEIANTAEQEVRSETHELAREISNELYAVWLDFQKDYRETLSLAGEIPEFKDILSRTTDLSKISLLVGVSLNNMGRTQLIASIKDGTFEHVLSLPEVSYKILESTHDLSLLIDWANLAGNHIEEVVELELYKHLSPKEVNHQLLLEILALKDYPVAISKVSLLDIVSVRRLLSIARQNLIALSEKLSADDLQRLAGYLEGLEQLKMNQIVSFLINDDSSIIKNVNVMTHIVQSRNINTAIDFWKADKSLSSLADGMLKLSTGAISWNLVIGKFGKPIILSVIALPFILIVLFLLASAFIYHQWPKSRQVQEISGESNAD